MERKWNKGERENKARLRLRWQPEKMRPFSMTLGEREEIKTFRNLRKGVEESSTMLPSIKGTVGAI